MKSEEFATAHVLRCILIICCLIGSAAANSSLFTFHSSLLSQNFHNWELEKTSDSLHALVLTTDLGVSRWRLPYPVYQFTTGDVDGDGTEDALVGVEKRTRYHPYGRRLFIFKNYKGHVRPLWFGSRVGGPLVDFCFCDGRVRCLETTVDGRYVAAEYEWGGFGLRFCRQLTQPTSREEAEAAMQQPAATDDNTTDDND